MLTSGKSTVSERRELSLNATRFFAEIMREQKASRVQSLIKRVWLPWNSQLEAERPTRRAKASQIIVRTSPTSSAFKAFGRRMTDVEADVISDEST